jgi:hypothetical protein
MKTLALSISIVVALLFSACHEKAGTVVNIDKGNNPDIEVTKYYFNDEGGFVYVSRYKSCPNVLTTTKVYTANKQTKVRGHVTIFENDSIQIIRKH